MKINDALNILGLSGQATKASAEKAFRKLAMQYHPDRNPAGAEMMKLLNGAWSCIKEFEGDVIHNTSESDAGRNYCAEVAAALEAIITLEGLVIEVCGNWVWIGGNTKEHKDAIKAAGFRWAKKKARWYFRPEDYRSGSRGNWSMDEIRGWHGSQSVATRRRRRHAALEDEQQHHTNA